MMRQGSTIAIESWDRETKPNLDWNHAWSTAPLNLISRFVLGVTPLEPGYARISVRPQPGGLAAVEGTVPTPVGAVTVKIDKGQLRVLVPVAATVVWGGKVHEVPAGRHEFK